LNELYYRYGFFFSHERLTDESKALAQGVEIILQKKLAADFYGLASAAVFRTRYRDGFGVWRDRVIDNRFLFSVEGGYKPNQSWEFSAHWIFADGVPYTPFDLAASTPLNRAVLNDQRLNSERYPDYHSLNVRCDRRFNFRDTNLIAYLSVWNAYNHKNVAQYFWNQVRNEPDVIYQWNLLLVIGLEYEF